MVGKCVLLLFGVLLVVQSSESVLLCPDVMANGAFTGKFTGVISREAWVKINYLFKPDGNAPEKCVQIDNNKYPTRAKVMWNAYKLNKLVEIQVDGEHEVSGIRI